MRAIASAAGRLGRDVEAIVVTNRCTDATADIAAAAGAIVVADDSRNIAAVRNAGAARATGDVLVTIDADGAMSPRTFVAGSVGHRCCYSAAVERSIMPFASSPSQR